MGLSFEKPDHPEVHKIYEELFVRYPILKNNRKSIWKAYLLMKQTYQNNAKVLCCGNGGSAADADHIVGELMKGFEKKRPINNLSFKGLHEDAEEEKIKLAYLKEHLQGALPAIALTQHTALSSAFSNDVAADMTFAQQVYGYGNKEDTLIAISTSGNSRNVENAVWLAKMRGLRTIGLTGERKSALSKLCDVTIQVPGESTAQIQELHLPVYHTLCAMVEAEFFEE
ncbi:MAG: SIS domain-containing protein [Clostridiales bacterium]|nr:SIS domain-containing protein [Clostridiales bacterium]